MSEKINLRYKDNNDKDISIEVIPNEMYEYKNKSSNDNYLMIFEDANSGQKLCCLLKKYYRNGKEYPRYVDVSDVSDIAYHKFISEMAAMKVRGSEISAKLDKFMGKNKNYIGRKTPREKGTNRNLSTDEILKSETRKKCMPEKDKKKIKICLAATVILAGGVILCGNVFSGKPIEKKDRYLSDSFKINETDQDILSQAESNSEHDLSSISSSEVDSIDYEIDISSLSDTDLDSSLEISSKTESYQEPDIIIPDLTNKNSDSSNVVNDSSSYVEPVVTTSSYTDSNNYIDPVVTTSSYTDSNNYIDPVVTTSSYTDISSYIDPVTSSSQEDSSNYEEPVNQDNEQDFYVAEDGSIWESEDAYNQWAKYNLDDYEVIKQR